MWTFASVGMSNKLIQKKLIKKKFSEELHTKYEKTSEISSIIIGVSTDSLKCLEPLEWCLLTKF